MQTTPRVTCSQGVLQRDAIQVYWRDESYNVRDIRMGTLDALIASQRESDRESKLAQRYVLRVTLAPRGLPALCPRTFVDWLPP